MTKPELEFLNFVKAAIWNEAPIESCIPQNADQWKVLLHQAERQSLKTTLFNTINNLPLQKQPEKKIVNSLFLNYVINESVHKEIQSDLAELCTLLRQENIEGVLLKGEGVAQNYPYPLSRACGDIDFYVGNNLYKQTCAFLKAKGLVASNAIESHKHLHFDYDKYSQVEIHRIAAVPVRFFSKKLFNNWVTKNIYSENKFVVNNIPINLPSATFNAFFLFYHAYYHFLSGGIGLRQICDWTLHLYKHSSEINLDELKYILSALKLHSKWNAFAGIAVIYLGLPRKYVPFYKENKKATDYVLSFIFEDGNFGFHNASKGARPKGYYSGKLYSLRNNSKRVFRLLRVGKKDTVVYFLGMLTHGIMAVLKQEGKH